MLLARSLILLEMLRLRTIHKLDDVISLPLLETEAKPLMAIVFIISLVLVILHLYEIAVDRIWRERCCLFL